MKQKKLKTKQAMTLLSIMFAMIVVMVAIVVAMPIFTKKLSLEEESEGGHGYFICYCANNDANQR